jgi:hypothetical protein
LLRLRDKTFHPVIVRLATVYGLSYRPRFDLVVNTLAARAFFDGEITIFGGGQWRPFVHVSDVAAALILCLERPLDVVDGQIFNVGSDDQNYTIRDIGSLILSQLPQTRVRAAGTVDDERNYHVSFAKIRDHLQFRPRMTVIDGIREIVAALAAGGITTYNDPRYHNAQFLVTKDGKKRVRAVHPTPLYKPTRLALEELLAPSAKVTGDVQPETSAPSAGLSA